MPAHFELMPGNWHQTEYCLCRPLIGTRANREAAMPWVAVATGVTPGEGSIIARDTLDTAQAQALLAEARSHLDALPITWQVIEQQGLLIKKPSVVRAIVTSPLTMRSGMDDLSSELILSARALEQAAAEVRSSDLVIVVPKRGWLLAGAGGPGDWTARKYMLDAAGGVFGRAGVDEAITPYVFHWHKGTIIGYEAFDGTSGYLSLMQPDESEWLL